MEVGDRFFFSWASISGRSSKVLSGFTQEYHVQVFDNLFIQLITFFGMDKKTRIKLSLKRKV
jgi:hypothetical protein